MDFITSLQNERVKYWKKLLTRKGRKKEQKYLVETWHLVQEASRSNALIECFMTQEYYDNYGSLLRVPITIITQDIVKELTRTQTPQAIFGVVALPATPSTFAIGKYILLDNIQDPGNVGTIIRTAVAAGFTGVIVGDGTVDIYNDKTVRSMQGSQFHINIINVSLVNAIAQLHALGTTVYATALDSTAKSLFDLPQTDRVAIVVGNEGKGVSEDILKSADEKVYIPMFGQIDSLNVAMASGIAMYHFVAK